MRLALSALVLVAACGGGDNGAARKEAENACREAREQVAEARTWLARSNTMGFELDKEEMLGLADEGGVRGFATVEYEPWHARLVLWFLYIAPEWRRRGVGRALLERVEAYGREVGASHVWLETSNVNVPGVAAYERLGYALCGADRLYYGDYMPGETAIYLAKMLEEHPPHG